jgi:endoglucanase
MRFLRPAVLAISCFAAALYLVACSRSASSSQPLFVDPSGPVAQMAQQARHDGDAAGADVLTRIAGVPMALWAAGQPGDIAAIRAYALQAAKAHRVGMVVAYDIPRRDVCGRYSQQSGPTDAGYKAWVSQLAQAIGSAGGRMVVVVEPDALPDMLPPRNCVSPSQAGDRYGQLAYAMRTLGALPNAEVYLDAGNPGMVSNPQVLAPALIRAGIAYGAGFTVNVSNFFTTAAMSGWVHQLEAALREKGLTKPMQAVIDVSRNGNGPTADGSWCNPPGRKLGQLPVLAPWGSSLPGLPGVAGLLWIKTPGVSDGDCHGDPPAGAWYPQYTMALAKGWSP